MTKEEKEKILLSMLELITTLAGCSEKGILDDKNKVVELDKSSASDRLWDTFMLSTDRSVAYDLVHGKRISTVFLGVNHGFSKRPLWFETMIFKSETSLDEFCERYETWDEAFQGHLKALDFVNERARYGK